MSGVAPSLPPSWNCWPPNEVDGKVLAVVEVASHFLSCLSGPFAWVFSPLFLFLHAGWPAEICTMSSIWLLCYQIMSLTFSLFGGVVPPVIQNAALRFTPRRFHVWFVNPPHPQSTLPSLSRTLTPEELQHISRMVQEGTQPLVNELRNLATEIQATLQATRQAGSMLETRLTQGLTFTNHGSLRSTPVASQGSSSSADPG
jgi:hypothetical protein